MEKEEVRAMLPKVGDKLWRVPSYLKWEMKDTPKRMCEVVKVDEVHMWYLVRFCDSGLTECFKPPRE
jgi:hypothetical protein